MNGHGDGIFIVTVIHGAQATSEAGTHEHGERRHGLDTGGSHARRWTFHLINAPVFMMGRRRWFENGEPWRKG